MKNSITELVFILDKSGSMQGLEASTISGFNEMLNQQKALKVPCFLTTVLFDDKYYLLHDGIDINKANDMTEKQYYVGGTTALLDAIGKTIKIIGNKQRVATVEKRANKVMFVIITDGMENASCQYSYADIKHKIQRQKAKYDWEFIFMGANIDAVESARAFGIDESRAQNFHADSIGVKLNFEVMGKVVANYRQQSKLDETWNKAIQNDYITRGLK